MMTLHWNFKDLFRACRLGLSAKKIWMQMVGVIVGGIGYSLFTYLAYWVAGANLLAVWERFSLVPFLDPYYVSPYGPTEFIPWWSWLIWAAGIIWLLLCVMVAGAAVAKVTMEQLRGDDFFEGREAFGYALSRLGVIIGTPLMPLLFIAFVVACGLILSALGAIPEFGPVFVGLFSPLAFGASLFIAYLLVVLLVALILGPTIAGATKNDTFDTLFEIFSCTNEQTWRVFWYSTLLKVLAIVCSFILLGFVLLAIRIGSMVLSVFMGNHLTAILSGGPFFLRLALPSWCPLYNLFPDSGVIYGGIDMPATFTVGQSIGAVLIGIAAYLLLAMVIGYSLSIWTVGQTISFCIMVRKKDDKNLLTEKDTEELLAEQAAACTANEPAPTPSPETPPPAATGSG